MAALRVAMTLEQCWQRVPGGTAVAALGVARELAAGDEVDLVGVAGRHRRPPPPPWVAPVPVHRLPLAAPWLYEAWHRLGWPAVERATGPVDVTHAVSLAVPATRAPLVVTVHDLAFLHEPEHFTAHGVRFLRRGMELARRRAAVVLCSSRATLDDCVDHGFPPDRLRLVPLGVDPPGADGDEAAARVRERYGLGRPYVLSAGTAEPRKNLPRLVEAFRRAGAGDDHDLVLTGPAGWGPDLSSLVEPLGDRVRAVGFVPAEDLHGLYAGASAVCYPSLREGFGFPVLEAMAHGAPVVTSAGTSTAELGEGGAALLVDPTDVDAIAAALDRVLGDAGEARRLSEAGRRRAAEYPWARTARLTVDAYHDAAGAARP